jgi:hypothetical protein
MIPNLPCDMRSGRCASRARILSGAMLARRSAVALTLARTGARVRVGRGGENHYAEGEACEARATWVDDSMGSSYANNALQSSG